MDTKVAALQKSCEMSELRTKHLAAWIPDSAAKPVKLLMATLTRLSSEVYCLAEELTNYAPRIEGCRCIELDEMLELIPKKLSLGEFLELKDLIHQHFNNH